MIQFLQRFGGVYVYVNKTMQPSPPSSETRVSPERLAEHSTGRKASFDPERSNKTFGCRAEAENSGGRPFIIICFRPT